MTMAVNKHIEGHYEIRLSEPERLWVELLKGKMLCEDVTVVSMVLGIGLVELLRKFGHPETLRIETGGL